MKDFMTLYKSYRKLGHGFWHSIKRANFWNWGMK